jgi:hypothetical protein
VLLIDELNNLPQSRGLAEFLKKNFVSRANRYLVFSSHVLTTVAELAAHMEVFSNRNVIVQPLPLVPSVSVARANFSWPSLSARKVLYYGMVPALIHEAQLDLQAGADTHLPNTKRDEVIQKCVTGGLVTRDGIRRLLDSFLSGDVDNMLSPLQQLIDTVSVDDGTGRVRWIPFHMMEALRKFSSWEGFRDLEDIVRLFNAFKNAKESSGDGWEPLFVAVLLIRC